MSAPPTPVRAFVLERMHEPFAWGARDCASLVFDAVRAATGRDPAASIRGRWHDARSAARLLRRLGGWEGLARQCWGPEVPVADAREGDVLLLGSDVTESGMAGVGALAVCVAGVAVAQGQRSLVWLPLAAARRAWRAA